jgi:hypothetical protein
MNPSRIKRSQRTQYSKADCQQAIKERRLIPRQWHQKLVAMAPEVNTGNGTSH